MGRRHGRGTRRVCARLYLSLDMLVLMKLVKVAQLQLSSLRLVVLFGRCGEGGRRQAVLLVAAAVAAAVLALGRGAAAIGSTEELAQERDVVFAVGVVQVVLDAAEAR